jgi:para-nitrobenzyl esterase
MFIFLIGRVFLVASFLLLNGCKQSVSTPLSPVVTLETGKIAGFNTSSGLRAYLGIPYASPPVGNLRWRSPSPPSTWEGTRFATQFGKACPQPSEVAQSEDCLYLNIWSPLQKKNELTSVMVWIHGGGFSFDSSTSKLYDGENLAKKGVIVVTFDYRLGALGFLGHPFLSGESTEGVSGNYGLLDQVAVLKWVKRNIAAFGGDFERVTIFGESAGGESITDLMVSPLAKGLFQRAIAESGAAGNYRQLRSLSGGLEPLESIGIRAANSLGCTDLRNQIECLRSKPPDEIVKKTQPGNSDMIQFAPVTDGVVLPNDPAIIFQEGKQMDVPLLAGITRDEAALNPVIGNIKTVSTYQQYLRGCFPKNWDAVWRVFEASSDSRVHDVMVRLLTVDLMARRVRGMMRDMKSVQSPAYLYLFSRVPPFAAEKGWGAFHSLDVYYVFKQLMDIIPGAYALQDFSLADKMQTYWTQFATDGIPHGGDQITWPIFNRDDSERYLELGDQVTSRIGFYSTESELLDRIDHAECGLKP